MSVVAEKKPEGTALPSKPSPTVPLVSNLAEAYTDDPGVEERYKQISTEFERIYGTKPEFYARAPGRVNLIGEHIDYEGYGVLPMAIRQDTVVAIRSDPGSRKLRVANVDSKKYDMKEFTADPSEAVDVAHNCWANYFVAAYKGAYELLAAARPDYVVEQVGMRVMVHGLVPTGSGLSSSAAFVCSAMLAVLAALGVQPSELDKAVVAEAACKAERYVGVTSGGMDQAISMMGQQGVAMHVEFNPVRVEGVVLPEGATFVIANSLAVSNKAETAPQRYNLRVVECRLAAVLLAMKLGMSAEDALTKARTLRDVEPLIAQKYGTCNGATCANAVSELLAEQYGIAEVEEALGGRRLAELFGEEPGSLLSVKVAEGRKYDFPLRKRAVHVYTEAQRVLDFQAVCEDASLSNTDRLTRLGGLMNDSHCSCADLYGCSCDELDELVAVARGAGALGARLTGAGWGGCIVALVRDGEVEGFLAQLRDKYYKPRVERGSITAEQLSESLFATKPASGAALLRLGGEGTEEAAAKAD